MRATIASFLQAVDLKLQVLYRQFQQAVRGLVQSWEDEATIDSMHRVAQRDDQEIETAVQRFLSAHPELTPNKWNISTERYPLIAFFQAVQAMELLFRRAVGSTHPLMIEISNEGALFLSGREAVSWRIVDQEIERMITDSYQPPPKPSGFLAKAVTREPTVDHRQAAEAFHRWILAALAINPRLLNGFVATAHGLKSAPHFLLTMVPVLSANQPLSNWT